MIISPFADECNVVAANAKQRDLIRSVFPGRQAKHQPLYTL